MMSKSNRALILCGTSMLILVATQAAAREGSAAPASQTSAAEPVRASEQSASVGTGDIVVTAQRRAERLEKVPIAVTSIPPARLEQLSIRSVDAIATVTPGLVFNTGGGFSQSFIRGIGTSFAQPGTESSVATYINGAYLPRSLGAVFDLLDVASVQVLKGPQGTLYGRNATGGAIIVDTVQPTNQFEGYVLGEYGRFDHAMGEGVLNLPVSSTLAVRLAGRYTREDGFIHNLATGRDEPNMKGSTLRGTIGWRPTSDLSAVLTLERNRKTVGPNLYAQRYGPGAIPGFYEASNDFDLDQKLKEFSANLRVRLSSGIFNIDSVTAYRDLTWGSVVDLDGSSAPIFHVGPVLVGGKTYSQDLTVSTDSGSWLDGLVGLSYAQDKSFQVTTFMGAGFAALPEIPFLDNRIETESFAVFGEATIKPTDALRITVGGRYSYDMRDLAVSENASANLVFAGGSGLLDFTQRFSFRNFTPRFVVAYDFGNLNAYVSYNRGFKAGGLPTPFFAPGQQVAPEKIESYEAGLKFVSPDRRLRANLAVFRYNHKDLQVTVVDLNSGGGVTRNAASARAHGVELDFNYTPVEGISVYGGGSYLHGRFRDFDNAGVNSVVGGALIPTFEDLSGTVLSNAPKWSGFVGGSIERAFNDSWRFGLNGSLRYTSTYNFFPGAGGNLREDKQDKFALLNVSGWVGPANGKFQIGAYANNLTNVKYRNTRQTSAPFGVFDQVAKPRTYGVRVKYAF